MDPIRPEHALARLRWRYATKEFDPSRKIPGGVQAVLEQVLEQALVLVPPSTGLQPWKFVVVTDPGCGSVQPVTYNQARTMDGMA